MHPPFGGAFSAPGQTTEHLGNAVHGGSSISNKVKPGQSSGHRQGTSASLSEIDPSDSQCDGVHSLLPIAWLTNGDGSESLSA